jgi:hypothetical protein
VREHEGRGLGVVVVVVVGGRGSSRALPLAPNSGATRRAEKEGGHLRPAGMTSVARARGFWEREGARRRRRELFPWFKRGKGFLDSVMVVVRGAMEQGRWGAG